MIHRRPILVLLAGAALLCGVPAAVRAEPTADQVLTDIRLSPADRQRVLNGEFVTGDLPAVSDTDLGIVIAFLVKTYMLSHLMATAAGAARAVVRRDYYVSAVYNGRQSVAGFLPVPGATVVVYTGHVFTDHITGFGAPLKRTLGSSVMASQMKEIFEAAREKAVR